MIEIRYGNLRARFTQASIDDELRDALQCTAEDRPSAMETAEEMLRAMQNPDLPPFLRRRRDIRMWLLFLHALKAVETGPA